MRTSSIPTVTGDFATGIRISRRRMTLGDFAAGMRTASAPVAIDTLTRPVTTLAIAA
jgi:hypothetical protein